MTERWIKYFFNIAKVVASQSKDPSKKVGAVLVDEDKQIISCGFNGFPSGYPEPDERYLNKSFKLSRVCHAEMNAVMSAVKRGVSTNNSSIFVTPLFTCSNCAKHLIQAGVKNVYCYIPADIEISDKWWEDFAVSKELYDCCGVNYKTFGQII